MQPVPGSVNIPIAKFPTTVGPAESNIQELAEKIIEQFNQGLASRDSTFLSSLFAVDGFWRDHLVLSWAFRTVSGRQDVQDYLHRSFTADEGPVLKSIALDTTSPARLPQSGLLDGEKVPCLIFSFILDSTIGSGKGVARLIQDSPGTWSIFTFYTVLQQLHGHEENLFDRRPQGVQHGGVPGRTNWAERRRAEEGYEDGSNPDVLILGAGQAGLTIAARLKAIGVNALMIDRCQRVGDTWRKRYHQLVLHDPVWFDHLPYIKFPPQWPIFTPKDKLAGFFEAYVNLLELNVWTGAEIATSKWNPQTKRWTVSVKRQIEAGVEETRDLHPRHIIQATGHSGKMNMPNIKGLDVFQGDRICHSSEFRGAREGSEGKKAVVVGCCNSAHDICQDFLEKGYHVTMVQRSTTCVITTKSTTDGLKPLYEEGGPEVDDADLLFHSLPASVLKAIQVGVTAKQNQWDADILRGLREAGFKVDKGPDDAGLFIKYMQRGGGYYIDVGASQLIADGKINLKQGQELEEVLPRGLKFADGSELEADEIIFATGYGNMRTETRQIFGDEVANSVDDVWGYNAEGETRTIWQRTGHPGFWFHGGNLALCRYYSKLLALQIKALEEGIWN
ncbi:hypothetical protein EDB81DRAFT_841793 [Dactylonectria macrodidyma]|uniref:Flavin-containing monooxygenase n=1 Tax=Dactylonectria macrodidyma TaxID=307937 RepID=A0A9P9F7D3_9HYPO|nr:hypothetical protein EDB81DRAFT_841793 [Dactylonectria macrodidyma]